MKPEEIEMEYIPYLDRKGKPLTRWVDENRRKKIVGAVMLTLIILGVFVLAARYDYWFLTNF